MKRKRTNPDALYVRYKERKCKVTVDTSYQRNEHLDSLQASLERLQELIKQVKQCEEIDKLLEELRSK